MTPMDLFIAGADAYSYSANWYLTPLAIGLLILGLHHIRLMGESKESQE